MLGLILLLVLKISSSNAVVATVGSTIILECTLSGSLTLWQKNLTVFWSSKLEDSSKYGNTNTKSLTMFNIDVNDAGTYRCTAGAQQLQITLTVICTWTQWSQWTTCSKTCDIGDSIRSRSCQGGSCIGSGFEIRDCTTTPCTSPGTWTQWSQWTTCSKTCGVGESTRSRSCQRGSCSGSGFERMDCTTTPCLVNGNWGVWGAWSTCSTTCGSGTWTRSRSCDNPAPANGGLLCPENKNDTAQCVKTTCPAVNGNWGAWGAWGSCSRTCGSGTMTRSRSCDNPAPANGGYHCPGNMYDTTQCSTTTCPVNGNWGAWGAWGSCSRTCNSGTWTRSRSCDNPTPAHGDSNCPGNKHDTKQCFKQACPAVNGHWGAWGAWGSCSRTCGSGTLTRSRSCDNPAPANGGYHCTGNMYDTTQCFKTTCPVNGNWCAWQDWNSCSVTCGSGSRSRNQECNNPEPSHGGSDCQGNDTEIEMCSIELCPVASEEENSSTAIGIGAGIGSTAVVVGLLIVFIYILKGNRLRNPAESVIYDTAGDTRSSNSDLHIYDGLQPNTESLTHRQSDVNYVNMVI